MSVVGINTALEQLFMDGPVWDGNLVSKADRDALVAEGLSVKVPGGWNTLTADGVQRAVAAGLRLSSYRASWYCKAARV